MDIQQIRQQYPQYNSLSNGELAFRLWNKDYKGTLPMGQFADRIGLEQSDFNQMVQFAEQSGYQPTTETGTRQPIGTGQGAVRSAFQGGTFGFGDEIVGGMAGTAQAASNLIQGHPANLGGEVARFTEQERERIGQFREESPVIATGSEIGGAIASGVAAPAVGAVQRLSPVARAAVTGSASGAAYGAGTAEGGFGERAARAVQTGIPSALFGAGTQVALNAVTPRLAALFQRSAERPSVESLRAVKNAAYQAVDDSGLKFDQGQIQSLASRARQIADDFDYIDDPQVFPNTYAALRILERRGGANETTIGQLDSLRQSLWQRLNASKGSEPAIGRMIDEIDDLIQNYPATDDLMNAARLANSRFKKAELLENAMQRAELQTASTGSGGNILNKYKQAVTSILTNPNQARWFTDVEKQQMEQLVRGTLGENALRQIGKLSPTGNGLMTALNIGAVAANPAMAAVSAAGAGAKAVSDRSGQRAMQGLLNTISGVPLRPAVQVPYAAGVPAGGASALSQLVQENR